MVALTDAEQRFADSPEGKSAIAYERNKHAMGEAHRGVHAQPWTDALEASLVRRMATQTARNAVNGSALLADAQRQAPILQAQADQARQAMIDSLNGWRK